MELFLETGPVKNTNMLKCAEGSKISQPSNRTKSATEKRKISPTEEEVKFRPSEAFKHLKKYFKWKFENSSNDLPRSTSPVSNACKENNINSPIVVQPPLPAYSPPPGVIKQEIDTDDYNSDTSTNSKLKEIMCRDFVRGKCKYGSACKYVHTIIKEQLNNVYTFCKEFQNKGCFFPMCKFVHCTIFEQENFYRTAELPPHVIDEWKHRHQSSRLLQPTLPPEEIFEVSAQIVPHGCVNTTVFETSSMADPGCSMLQSANENRPIVDCSTSSNKRKWSETYDSNYPQCDLGFREPPPKKCKDCDSRAFRFQFFKNKVKEMTFASDDYKLQIAQLNKKTQRLMALLKGVGHL